MIKIEVTGNSLAEVSDKLLAIGASLQRTAVVTEAPVQMRITAAGDMVWEVAEEAPENPTPAPKSAPAAEATESQPTTEEPATTPAPAVAETASSRSDIAVAQPETSDKPETSKNTAASSESSASELNFDTDIAPIVLQVVKDKGKPVVQAILEEFGVERASQLDPARWPELIAQLKDAL
jgi:hypothetical protein